jgi:hypothetical protein
MKVRNGMEKSGKKFFASGRKPGIGGGRNLDLTCSCVSVAAGGGSESPRCCCSYRVNLTMLYKFQLRVMQ